MDYDMGKGVMLKGKGKENIYPVTASDLVYDPITKKNVKEELGGKVEEAPKNDKQYARVNGSWAEVEAGESSEVALINLTPSVYELNGVTVKVTTNEGETLLDTNWQGTTLIVQVREGVQYTVTVGEKEGFKAPQPVTFTAIKGVPRSINMAYEQLLVGVFIQAVDGTIYKKEEWSLSGKQPNGIAVLSDTARFVVSLSDYSEYPLGDGAIAPNLPQLNYSQALSDFDGLGNTNVLLNTTGYNTYQYLAWQCVNRQTFPNGKPSYIGSSGEWVVLSMNLIEVNELLEFLGKTIIALDSLNKGYWTSSRGDGSTLKFYVSSLSEYVGKVSVTEKYRGRFFQSI